MAKIAGMDGARGQWCAVMFDTKTGAYQAQIVGALGELLAMPNAPEIIAIDIPIGLPDVVGPGGRQCEATARQLLGRPRASSVFSAVGRCALRAPDRATADRVHREHGGIGIGSQAWAIKEKLIAIDNEMTPKRQRVVHEVHPEVTFWAMADGRAMAHRKKSAPGRNERREILLQHMPEQFLNVLPLGAAWDDYFDACAAVWTGQRILNGAAVRLPANVGLDPLGLDMAIWY